MQDMKDDEPQPVVDAQRFTTDVTDSPNIREPEWYTADAISDDRLCVICIRIVENPHAVGPCDHIFCQNCLAHLIHARCPTCSAPFDKAQLIPKPSIKRAISKLQMTCKECHMFRGDISAMTKHWKEVCAPRTCNACHATVGNAKAAEAHQCVVKCELCTELVPFQETTQHEKMCLNRPGHCLMCNTDHMAVTFKAFPMAWLHIKDMQVRHTTLKRRCDGLSTSNNDNVQIQASSAARIAALEQQVKSLSDALDVHKKLFTDTLEKMLQEKPEQKRTKPTFAALERVRVQHSGKFVVTPNHWDTDALRVGDIIAVRWGGKAHVLAKITRVHEGHQVPICTMALGAVRHDMRNARDSPDITPAFLHFKAWDPECDGFKGDDFDFLRSALAEQSSDIRLVTVKRTAINTFGGWTCCGNQDRLDPCSGK